MDKSVQRRLAYAGRNAQADKDAASAEICRRFIEQPWQRGARTVLWYVDCRSEVRTQKALAGQLLGQQRIAVPYCTQDADGRPCLGLWRLKDINELRPGRWNILEPPPERRHEAERIIQPTELDAVMVPGVAFDRAGGRLGNGAGYYDRLLSQVRPDAVLAGVCYEAQLVPAVALAAHDVYMDAVITERAIYQGNRRHAELG